MSYSVAGKHVLVTGASSGIGAALAEGFAVPARPSASARVAKIACVRCSNAYGRTRPTRACGSSISPTSTRWTRSRQRASEELGGIDVLVNNAGIPKRRTVTALDFATVEAVMAINYLSPIRLTLALLPELMERGGRIVNISSVAARLGPPSEAAYTASKAALTGWSESMQVDLGIAGSDVKVHVVNPGVIDTELFHLPDNEKSLANIEALPVEAIVEPVLTQLDAGTFEIYVPEWFADVVAQKFPDTGAFLAGSIAWARQELGVND